MQRPQIPSHLQSTRPELETTVPVDMPAHRAYSVDQVNALNSKLGLIKVDGERLAAYQQLGISAQALGIANMIHGATMMTLDQLLQMIAFNYKIAVDPGTRRYRPKQKVEAANVAGYLAGQLAKVTGSSTKVHVAQVNEIVSNDRKMRQSYAPGVTINLPKESAVTS